MFILSKQDVELKKANPKTVVMRYRQRIFRRVSQFTDVNAAVAACREGLDSGKFCVVLKDGMTGQEVWQAIAAEELKALMA